MSKKTPLYQQHVLANGKLIDFFGFTLPIQYESGIVTEHLAVRNKVGLFDVSHMGEFFFHGPNAATQCSYLTTINLDTMKDNQVRYGFLCYQDGSTVDDCLLYKFNQDKWMMVVNGANIEKDKQWILDHLTDKSCFSDQSDQIALIAIQGPLSEELIKKGTNQIPTEYYTFLDQIKLFGKTVLCSRTGYTGEDGFEVYCSNEDAPYLWQQLLQYKDLLGVTCCGLGARDTLRLEAGMPLYGHELSDKITPIEAGLKYFVRMEKDDFIGKAALSNPIKQKRIGLICIEKGIPREGYQVFQNNQMVGVVTSGTYSPTLQVGIAMALVDHQVDTKSPFEIEIRNKNIQAQATTLPFVKRSK